MQGRVRNLGSDSLVARVSIVPVLVTLMTSLIPGRLVLAQDSAGAAPDPATTVSEGSSVESLFVDFLHYATLGRFTAANAHAEALLNHPNLDPREVLALATSRARAVQTLQILVANSTVGSNAARVLELIEEGQRLERKDEQRILNNINLLGGDPQQEFDATRHLVESGEYAVPLMVSALLDEGRARLHRRILTALPKLGRGAVGPLVMALNTTREDVRIEVVRVLGEIGYVQATPYLMKLAGQANVADATRQAANDAIGRIAAQSGRAAPASASSGFFELADRYYAEDAGVAADSREPTANIWYWNASENRIEKIEVETGIFGQVMAMRCAEEALQLQPDQTEAIALWLAANIRREGRLGMNVESGDPGEAGRPDGTRPAEFPRALYFTQAAGPRYAHMILDRAVRDRDSAVALGAIEALRLTAGASSLTGSESYKQPLVQALQFPDVLVRIRAALALGAALPTQSFVDSDRVIPVLSEALALSGRVKVLVVAPSEEMLNRVTGGLRSGDCEAIGEKGFFTGMSRARREFEHLGGVFLSTGMSEPDLAGAMAGLRREFAFSQTPVVILTAPEHRQAAEDAAGGDAYCELVEDGAEGAALLAALANIRSRTSQKALSADEAFGLALQAAQTLEMIAGFGRTVYDFPRAEPALIGALASGREELQTLCASVLGQVPSASAQRSIAHVALEEARSESLRVAAFAALARSARNFGNQLEPDQVTRLLEVARSSNLTLRTASSRALGALNLADNQASAIIRGVSRG